ncbi:protein-glutamate methylesterase/protein-glutamine glutaminase [Dissulfurirhabdus thermomarina]|nr:chemotaxis response regulator protein-glutamate methylesterase [Dissulfurirhabdus thermomarina]
MIKVLAVDDSAAFRRILTEALASDPGIQVVGTAASGLEVPDLVRAKHPDLLVLDVEMPGMDGLQTLDELRRQHLRVGAIMFSALTSEGAATTLEALAKGAFDFVPKPTGTGAFVESIRRIKAELIPKIHAFATRRAGRAAGAAAPAAQPAPRRTVAVRPEAVAIGISTGGPNALNEVIPRLPAGLRVPVLLVQHMPPVFTAQLARRLDERSPVRVVEAVQGQRVEPGTVYIAPGDQHMEVRGRGDGRIIHLHQGPPVNSCRPSADVLFRSVAEAYGGRALAVVMTGMGQDGLEGARRLREAGGRVIAQDRETCVVWGMPRFVAEAGLADEIRPLGEIASAIQRVVGLQAA